MKLDLAQLPAILRPADVAGAGHAGSRLRPLLRSGSVTRLARGVYLNHAAAPSELATVAAVCSRVPDAIVCLFSALLIHDIGTQLPHAVWIAVHPKARKPNLTSLSTRIVRFSGPSATYGVLHRTADGIPFRITSPARTIVDCFRYRNKLGLDVALEALTDGVRRKKVPVAEIDRAADVLRMRNVMRPYLEMLLA
ncbi:MAG: transcriptional regulator [Planctomycetes bacterium]|nr:transcriptional regulator [Planctomycetota bacterium]